MPVFFRYCSAFRAMCLGSRGNGFFESASTMSHMKQTVGTALKGSTNPVERSGMRERSPSSRVLRPAKFEPSNPRPTEKSLLSALDAGTVRRCQRPRKSVNFRSTSLTPRRLISDLSLVIEVKIAQPPFIQCVRRWPHVTGRGRGRGFPIYLMAYPLSRIKCPSLCGLKHPSRSSLIQIQDGIIRSASQRPES